MKGVWAFLGALELALFLADGIRGDGWDITRLALSMVSLLLADAMHDRDEKARALTECRRLMRLTRWSR